MSDPYSRHRFVVWLDRYHDALAAIGHTMLSCDDYGERMMILKIGCVICRAPAVLLAPIDEPRRERWPYCRTHSPGRGTPVPRVPEGALTALRLVWEIHLSTKVGIADLVAGRESRAYGYRMIDRAIEADLIKAEKVGRSYRLSTTRLGRAILGQLQETR